MNAAIVTWLVLRVSRWLLWLAFFAYSIHFNVYRESHLDAYGHLFLTTELVIFGLAEAAVFAGFLELMMRERAGIPRPTFGRLMPASEARENSK
jgi:hypothetical protein